MDKITFLGAGSTVFAKNVLGDCMMTEPLREFEYALYDIDPERLEESYLMLSNINKNSNGQKARIAKYRDRREALRGARYVINAIQVGGYEPCTVTDFEIPKKYGLRQTIGDTVGIGGIFRALRTIPVMLDFAEDMEEVCPDALFLNYTNPMAMLTMAMLRASSIRTVGICHSVQVCVPQLLYRLGLPQDHVKYRIAGINHMAWLLEITRNGEDYYPEIKRRAKEGPVYKPYTKEMLKDYPQLLYPDYEFTPEKHDDLVRFEIMKQFGCYVTESSEHNAEYLPFFIKDKYPELIDRFNIPLDEYPRRCIKQIAEWEEERNNILKDGKITHERSREYASYIMEAVVTNKPYQIGGNVLNTGLIDNLPSDACVEVPCMINAKGVNPCHVGRLPVQLAAMNQTNINVQLLTIEAARTRDKNYIYQAAMLDPHTAAELNIDDIRSMCDELIEAHGEYMAMYK